MNELSGDVQFFELNQEALSRRYAGKVLVIRGQKVVAVYESAVVARREAEKEFRGSTYLIREISRTPVPVRC